MELKIYNPQEDGFVQKIEWNYEELKTEVAAAADEYAVSVYTDETIKQAKADRAKLNKFVDARAYSGFITRSKGRYIMISSWILVS